MVNRENWRWHLITNEDFRGGDAGKIILRLVERIKWLNPWISVIIRYRNYYKMLQNKIKKLPVFPIASDFLSKGN